MGELADGGQSTNPTPAPPAPTAPTRRGFVQASSAALAAGYFSSRTETAHASGYQAAGEQPVLGFIGTGIRFHTYLGWTAIGFGPCAGIADVDTVQAGRALQIAYNAHRKKNYPLDIRTYSDYRKLLDRKDVDVVYIATPDHWHAKIAIDAMRAGKDVYCEKPLTLTIREGQQIYKVMQETKRVFQIGSQQRSEFGQRFIKAAAIARENRVGKVSDVTAALGGSIRSGVLPVAEPSAGLDWNQWLGPAPMVEYRASPEIKHTSGWGAGHPFSRAHRYYRWWYEYSGGKLTDWGAHHVDIALWAMNRLGDDAGVVTIDPIMVEHPVPFKDGMPTKDDQFNCATKFHVKVQFDDGLTLHVRDNAGDKGFGNGIMFEGDQGRYFVNRGKLTGRAPEALEKNPLKEETLKSLYVSGEVPSGKPGANIRSFIDCVKSRNTPSSDIVSHNRTMNICHGVNIAMRLGKTLKFNTKTETFESDVANGFLERKQREGFEIDV